jgi:hypothetical protein
MNVMGQSKVLEKQSTSSKLFKVKIIKEHILEKYQKIIDVVEDLGILNTDTNFYEADIDAVAGMLDLKPASLKTKFRELDKDGYIIYVAPFRGTPLKIISDLSLINFNNLEKKADMERRKLQDVSDFIKVPNTDKLQFLHDYFS